MKPCRETPRKGKKRQRDTSSSSSEDYGKKYKKADDYTSYHEAFKSLRFRSPFTDDVNEVPIPRGLKPPVIKKYDGTGDPDAHVSTFMWAIKTIPMDPRLWCIFFAGSLDGPARYWLDSLPSRSIGGFEQLCDEFCASFIQQRRFQSNAQSIFACRQRDGETNRAFLTRFNTVSREMPSRSDPMIVAAFTYGLKPGPLFKKLVTKNITGTKELLERVNKFIRQEEESAERLRCEPRGAKGSSFKNENIRGGRPYRGLPFRPPAQFSPRPRSGVESYAAKEGRPYGGNGKQKRYPRDRNAYCEFHKIGGHSTADCEALRKEKEQEKEKAPGKKPPVKEEPRVFNEIHTIMTEEEQVRRFKRKRQPSVHFHPDDPRPEKHQGDEPLLIRGSIGKDMISRVYVDTGSSGNIMYDHCFRQLSREIREYLTPATSSVVGFTGQAVWPKGNICLPITFYDHSSDRKRTVLADFIVIEAPSPYNIICGRTGLWQLQAIASTVHGTMKMPGSDGTITVLGRGRSECSEANTQTSRGSPENFPKEKDKEPGTEVVVINPKHSDQPVRIGTELTIEQKASLTALLRANADVFAWKPTDMT